MTRSHKDRVHRAFALSSLLAITGCTINTTVEDSAIDYNESIERTVNQTTFNNVLRSMHRMPRHYTAIAVINGNLKLTAGGSLAATLPGSSTSTITSSATPSTVTTHSGDVFTPGLSGSFTTNPTFSVSVLESEEFYRGILQPLSTQVLGLYVSQGWDSELLTHLFVESVQFRAPSGITRVLRNDPCSDDWKRWAGKVEYAETLATAPRGVRIDELDADGLLALWGRGASVRECDGKTSCKDTNGYLVTPKTNRRLVMNTEKIENIEFIKGLSTFESDSTGDGQDHADSAFVKNFFATQSLLESENGVFLLNPNSKESITLVTRSTDGIVYSVGEYLRRIAENSNCEISIDGGDALFRVEKGAPEDGALVVGTVNGQPWFITPDADNRAMQILGLIQQLVNLHRKGENVPQSNFIQIN